MFEGETIVVRGLLGVIGVLLILSFSVAAVMSYEAFTVKEPMGKAVGAGQPMLHNGVERGKGEVRVKRWYK